MSEARPEKHDGRRHDSQIRKHDAILAVVPPAVVLFRPGLRHGPLPAPSVTRARTPAIRGTPGAVGGGCRHSSCAG